MPDFHQPGPILSLPLIRPGSGANLDAALENWSAARPLALLLPCHARDLHGPALAGMIAELSAVRWIACILVGLDGAGESDYAAAQKLFAPLGSRCHIVWHHSAPAGKGRNLKTLAGEILRQPDIFAVAMHDCDIRSYSRDFLARLYWPVLHPDSGLSACKGYYARSDSRLHGRLFRLMFQPLLRAVAAACAPHPWLQFLQSLRYPLSGELCVQHSLLPQLHFAEDWGVEVSLLHSLYRATEADSLCQAELCEAYDHKHQDAAGLLVMAREVAAALRRTFTAEDLACDPAALGPLLRTATARAVRESLLISTLNGMPHDPVNESSLAEAFTATTLTAFTAPPLETGTKKP